MRILIHSNGPMVPTGYGKQCKLLIGQLKKDGHEVAVSAFYGVSGGPIDWEGTTIFPGGMMEYGKDVLYGHYCTWEADMLLCLMDFWKMADVVPMLKAMKTAALIASDCSPLSMIERQVLAESGAHPLAMSRFGQQNLEGAGFPNTPYFPHAVDTAVFCPAGDRHAIRRALGIPDDRFVVGICAANHDAYRKGFAEQFEGFAKFRQAHPEALLLVHSMPYSTKGLNLIQLAEDQGLSGHVVFADQYAQMAGIMTDENLADWYNCLDVLLACSYGEGFGVPMIEAQACGVPVISTYASAMIENNRAGFHVLGSRFWNPVHRGWWVRPDVDNIASCLGAVHGLWLDGQDKILRTQARQFTKAFSLDRVARKWWWPEMKRLEAILT